MERMRSGCAPRRRTAAGRRLAALAIGLAMCALAVQGASAQQALSLRKAAILTTITESALATASLIRTHLDSANINNFHWSSRFSDREWQFDAQGSVRSREFTLRVSGYLWGADKANWSAEYSGLGQLGDEMMSDHGNTVWLYNRDAADYRDMNFRQVMKFGQHSFWGWVLGAEVVVGGTVGAAGGLVTAGPIGAAVGGLTLGSGLVGASAAAKALLADDPKTAEAPPAPAMPPRPAPPEVGQVLVASAGKIYTAVSSEGELLGYGPDGVLELSGKYSNDGTAEGVIANIK